MTPPPSADRCSISSQLQFLFLFRFVCPSHALLKRAIFDHLIVARQLHLGDMRVSLTCSYYCSREMDMGVTAAKKGPESQIAPQAIAQTQIQWL